MNLATLRKGELIWMATHRCQHRHLYIEHPSCYEREILEQSREKIGFLDIETFNLEANFGIMLSYCIKISGKDEIIERLITTKELRSQEMDKPVVSQCVRDIQQFDRIVGHY